MGVNEIQNFVIKNVKMLGQNSLFYIKGYPYHLCIMLLLCILYLFSPLVSTILAYCFPVFGIVFCVCRLFIGSYCRPKVKSIGSKRKTWKELNSHRSFRSVYTVHVPKQHNERSFMQDQPTDRQIAKEVSNKIISNMNTKDKDVVFSTINDNLADKKALIVENPKEIQKSFDVREDKGKRHDHGNKIVRWMDDNEKSLMDLGISEVERTKRIEGLIERRRSRKFPNFQIIRNAIGVGVGNNSCSQISSLHIPKKNPFLSSSSVDLNSYIPGSAPSYMVKNNPFDLPYDPHEERPILTGDGFDDEFTATRQKEALLSRHDNEPDFDIDFAIKQLRRLGTSKVAIKEDDNKQPQEKCSILNDFTDDTCDIEEGESSKKEVDEVHILDEKAGTGSYTKAHEVHNDVVSSDQSTSSSSSSEDEPILRPNKEAILHCLSMLRMRIVSQGSNIRRNAESFDCGPSALFDKSKTDGFFFAANKRIHYGSTNSFASDMQVEVSELGSPPSTNMSSLDEDGKGSLVNSTNPSELDLRDIDEMSEQGTIDSHLLESTMKPDKSDDQDAHFFMEEDRQLAQDHKDSCSKLESSTDQDLSSSILYKGVNEVQSSNDRTIVVESLDQLVPDSLPPNVNDK